MDIRRCTVRVCFKLPFRNVPEGDELNKAVHLLISFFLLLLSRKLKRKVTSLECCYFDVMLNRWMLMVTIRSKACIVFRRSNTTIVGSKPTRFVLVCPLFGVWQSVIQVAVPNV
jgi:hypothetical protein